MSILLLIVGVAVGIVFGSIPGLSAAMAVALFLPVTFAMQAHEPFTFQGRKVTDKTVLLFSLIPECEGLTYTGKQSWKGSPFLPKHVRKPFDRPALPLTASAGAGRDARRVPAALLEQQVFDLRGRRAACFRRKAQDTGAYCGA